MWEAGTTPEFDEWFAALSKDAQVEVTAAVTVLRQIGPTLGRPLVDTLKGSRYANLKELRVGTGGQIIRIAFAFDPLQAVILLIGGDKGGISSGLFYRRLIDLAERLYARHLGSIARRVREKRDPEEATGKAKGRRKGKRR
ncbi:MAG: type II toxin-antitoxin system RelE/ParE family toxin [Tepidisphaeraceae bacterium]